ncbi:MAG: hypothetical protein JJU02_11870 [Cryomorphaceae bacterium]|nr:hypothetical protein [Cryomorphaceae bacterium]
MRTIILAFLLFFSLTACQEPKRYQWENNNRTAQDSVLEPIIRYLGKMPDKASPQSRFYTVFDDHYSKQLGKYQITHLHQKGSTTYFAAIRIAPSIKEKYVATAGFYERENDSITNYEEVFRTWKMTKEELMPKLDVLFDKLVKAQSLVAYYPENSGEEEYIEFPNSEVYYNKNIRTWETTREDVLQEFYQKIEEME